jgi:RNA polymerase sigma-70 factor (ECF subfamily)
MKTPVIESPEELESRIRAAFDSRDYDTAATLFIEHYGGEILGFLAGRLRNPSDAAEVFSLFAEDFWSGLPGFQWRSSMRSWAYTLARNAAYHYRHDPHRNRLHLTTITSKKSRFAQAVTQLRAATKMHLRTEIKSQVRDLYKKLPDDDQSLLFLRIDKQMSWPEIAIIMSGQGEAMEDDEVKQWANRLRQRFHAVKQRLKELAKAEGLL